MTVSKQLPKVLIVDDKQAERMVLGKLLSKFDVELHDAESGKEALSKLIRHDYALVLLDVHMPIMDGIETAKLIRSNPATEKVPIIFLTAFDKDEIEIEEGYEVGAIDYLIKPLNEDILQSKIKTFLKSYSFEKEKEYEKILAELENKNKKLEQARHDALRMMEEANNAKAAAQESRKQIVNQTAELLQYTKELEQFAYVATHDLRAPIINLDGFVKLFRKRGHLNNDNREIIERMEASVDRINTTLRDLIEVVAYKKTLSDEIRPIEISQLFNNILQDLEVQIREAKAEITTNFRDAPRITYIPGHLRSILQNLLSNSISYRSPERRPLISVSSSMSNDTFCLTVKDNGIGIDEKHKEKVFGLFQRLATDVKGKGIGLYITRSQVEAMGGCVDFTSQPGVGTEFKVFLKNLPSRSGYLT
ncbi:MAG: response regulator [Pseudohongiellaceae bacterium]